MATSKYPDDEVEKCTSEEQMFDLIDEKLPTNSNFVITGKRIREALKSLFMSVLPDSEKEYKYKLNFFHLQYSGIINSKHYLQLYNPNQGGTLSSGGDYYTTAAINKLKEAKYYRLFPKLNTGYSRGNSNYNSKKSCSNIEIDFSELYFDSGYIFIEVKSGYDILNQYDELILVTSENEIPIQEKIKNISGNDKVFEKLVIPNDADSIELCINDYSSCSNSFYPIVLSYIEYENETNVKNGKKLKLKLKGGYEELNGFYLYDSQTVGAYKAYYNSKLYKKEGDLYVDVTTYGTYPDSGSDYYIKDINNNYTKVNLFNDGLFDDVPESSRPSSYAETDTNLCVMRFGIDSNIPNECIKVKLHHTPNLFFYPPSYYVNSNYLINNSSKFIYDNKVLYDFDDVYMDKDFSVNGVYTMSGFAYSQNSTLWGIKDSYLEFTLWDKKWFINGITF